MLLRRSLPNPFNPFLKSSLQSSTPLNPRTLLRPISAYRHSLYEPLPSYHPPQWKDEFQKNEKAPVTTLSNGIRVASIETFQPNCSIGMYWDLGSSWEQPNESGICHFLERMSFKSTDQHSAREVLSRVEKHGGVLSWSSSRDTVSFRGDIIRTRAQDILSVLSDNLLRSQYPEQEILEALPVIEYEIRELPYNHGQILGDLLHLTALDGPLARPLYSGIGAEIKSALDFLDNEGSSDQKSSVNPFFGRLHNPFSSEDLKKFVKKHLVGDRIVIAATGIDHPTLVDLCEKYFSAIPSSSSSSLITPPKTFYQGGEKLVMRAPPYPPHPPEDHVIISFEAPGLLSKRSFLSLALIQTILGGGGAFSAGGPGKGMHTRLYTDVLHQHGWLYSCSAMSVSYADVSLFGIHGSVVNHKNVGSLTEVVATSLMSLLWRPPSQLEMEVAKKRLKSNMFMNLESRSIMTEDLGKQITLYGSRLDSNQLVEEIDSITVDELLKEYRTMISSKPTFVLLSDSRAFSLAPQYQAIHDFFQSRQDK